MVRRTICTLLPLLLLAGCDWKADGAARLKELYPQQDLTSTQEPEDTVTEFDLPDTPYAGGDDIQLNKLWGYYAVRMELPGTMEFFPGNPPYDLLLTNLFVASWSDDGLEWQYCTQKAEIDAGGLGATEMLPATDAALGQVPIVLESAEGVGIVPQKIAWTWGVQGMEDPFNDPLPAEASDELVWDQDNDGNPGVTIKVIQPEGYRFMVRRSVWDIKPADIGPGAERLEGTLDFKVDEGAVGYEGSSTLATIIPIVADKNGGTYVMVRTEEYLSCEQLLADYPAIFE